MTSFLSEFLGVVSFCLGGVLFLFLERFAVALAVVLEDLSDRLSRRRPIFPAASLPEFPKGIPPLVNQKQPK